MSGHHSICFRAVGSARGMPPRGAHSAAFAPAHALPAHFSAAQTAAAAFAPAALFNGAYETRRNLTAVFASAAAL